MAQAFQTRIEDIVGDAVSGGDLSLSANMLGDWFNDGFKVVIGRLPDPALRLMAISAAFGTNGTTIENARVLDVLRSDGTYNRRCSKMPHSLIGAAGEKGSLYEPTANWPIYYEEPQTTAGVKIKVLPAASAADSGATIVKVTMPASASLAATSITGWPNELEDLPVWYAAAMALFREAGYSRRKAQDEIEAITSSGILANLATTYTNIGTALDATNTNLDAAAISTALTAAATAYGRINTASALANAEYDKVVTATTGPLDLANVEFDKVAAIIDLANTEYDKVDALLTLGQTDTEADVNTALAAVATALGKVAAIIVEGSSEIDTGSTELDAIFSGGTDGMFDEFDTAIADVQGDLETAQNVLGSGPSPVTNAVDDLLVAASATSPADEDVIQHISDGRLNHADRATALAEARVGEATATVQTAQGKLDEARAELENIQTHIAGVNPYWANATAYFDEAKAYVAEAQGYAAEVNARLAQALAKREEGVSRSALGDSYLREAQARITNGNSYLEEAKTRISAGDAYLREAQMGATEGNGYVNEANARVNFALGYAQEAVARGQKAQVYLGECSIRIQTASDYSGRGKDAHTTHKDLMEKFEARLDRFIQRFEVQNQRKKSDPTTAN